MTRGCPDEDLLTPAPWLQESNKISCIFTVTIIIAIHTNTVFATITDTTATTAITSITITDTITLAPCATFCSVSNLCSN